MTSLITVAGDASRVRQLDDPVPVIKAGRLQVYRREDDPAAIRTRRTPGKARGHQPGCPREQFRHATAQFGGADQPGDALGGMRAPWARGFAWMRGAPQQPFDSPYTVLTCAASPASSHSRSDGLATACCVVGS
jgi:hypothetical protein